MKKIYCFYLYGYKDELRPSNYPAIEGLDIINGNNYNHILYAWTPNKVIRKLFKQQRDMNKFREIIHELPKDEFNKFADEYSDTFLEERGITTKDINEYNVITTKIVYILATAKELDIMIDNDRLIARKLLQRVIDTHILLKEEYFIEEYRRALQTLKFNNIISSTFSMDDADIPPFNIITDDSLAIYSHLYYNTYRKDIGKI